MPPTIHVAGTNGKGSVCAYLRAMLEGSGLPRSCLHLAASGALSRTHPRRRPAHLRRRSDRDPGRVRARQPRSADHLLRDHDRGRVPRLLAPRGRRARARSGPGRTLRCDQRDRRSGRRLHRAGRARPSGIPRRHAGGDRGREGGHHQARPALHRRPAVRRSEGRDHAPRRSIGRRPLCPRRGLRRACRARPHGLSGYGGFARSADAQARRPASDRQCRARHCRASAHRRALEPRAGHRMGLEERRMAGPSAAPRARSAGRCRAQGRRGLARRRTQSAWRRRGRAEHRRSRGPRARARSISSAAC